MLKRPKWPKRCGNAQTWRKIADTWESGPNFVKMAKLCGNGPNVVDIGRWMDRNDLNLTERGKLLWPKCSWNVVDIAQASKMAQLLLKKPKLVIKWPHGCWNSPKRKKISYCNIWFCRRPLFIRFWSARISLKPDLSFNLDLVDPPNAGNGTSSRTHSPTPSLWSIRWMGRFSSSNSL